MSDSCVENVDIGGPAMILSASKNYASVVVVIDAVQYYPELVTDLDQHQGV
jgi:phosphoribosylaminoimidazolecarboxamide formyltransferase/IMP cyclohydrolase